LGLTQPGMTVVCGDSHTSTHGAFGALAFGIGTSQVAHVLASQCLLQTRPKTLEVRVDGTLRPGVSAKDVILAVCARLGVDGATYDRTLTIDGDTLSPMITCGTNPGMGMSITDTVPDPDALGDRGERESAHRALRYMGLTPGQSLAGTPVDVVFFGSCTNA